MSLKNLEDSALKEAYTIQIERNKNNRRIQPVNGFMAGKQSPSGESGFPNSKRSVVSIDQRSQLFLQGDPNLKAA